MKMLCLVTFLVALFSTACTPKNSYLDSFETVWQTVNEEHYDTTFNGIDWKAVHEEYQQRILKVKSVSDFIPVVNEMLFKLNLSHLLVIEPDDLSLRLPILFAAGSIGIQVRIIDNTAVISHVKKNSPAAIKGLKVGYTILSVDDQSVEQIIKNSLMIPPFNERHKLNRLTNDLMGHIYGPPNTDVSIVYLDRKNNKFEKTFNRSPLKQPTDSAFSALPPYYLEIKSKLLKNKIGYIWINQFDESLEDKIAKELVNMRSTSGIIIDLRGNSGGFFSTVDWLAEQFISKKTILYQMKFRNKIIKKYISPSRSAYKGKLVILIDSLSTSASEAFAAGIQELGRGIIIGERSPGFILGCRWKGLSNGTVLMHTVAQILTPSGQVLEGHGVIPDIRVKLDQNRLRKGEDNQLEEGINYINSIESKRL